MNLSYICMYAGNILDDNLNLQSIPMKKHNFKFNHNAYLYL